MNNYDSLVSLVPVKVNGVEKKDNNGNKLFYKYDDITEMISTKESGVDIFRNLLQQEERFREEEAKRIRKNQDERKRRSGKNVNELIKNFDKSMVLLERR